MNPRSVLLGIALVATLAASWWAVVTDESGQDSSPSAAAPAIARGEIRQSDPRSGGAPGGLVVQREPWPAWGAALFEPLVMAAPPQPLSPAPMVSSQAGAPPLPFVYVGEIQDAAGRAVILTEGDEVHIVRARQRIGELYRVERITATEVEFTYLPLMQRQLIGTLNHDPYQ